MVSILSKSIFATMPKVNIAIATVPEKVPRENIKAQTSAYNDRHAEARHLQREPYRQRQQNDYQRRTASALHYGVTVCKRYCFGLEDAVIKRELEDRYVFVIHGQPSVFATGALLSPSPMVGTFSPL